MKKLYRSILFAIHIKQNKKILDKHTDIFQIRNYYSEIIYFIKMKYDFDNN